MMYRNKILIPFVILLVSATHATITSTVQYAACNSVASLKCENGATDKFSAVAWRKISNGTENVLLRMDEGKDTEFYENAARMKLGMNKSLIISTVTPGDSGEYQCKIYALVGKQDMISTVNLIVHECPVTTLMTTLTASVTATACSPTGPQQQGDRRDVLTIPWTIGTFSVVVFCKITLSLVAIKVRRVCAGRRQTPR